MEVVFSHFRITQVMVAVVENPYLLEVMASASAAAAMITFEGDKPDMVFRILCHVRTASS